MKRNFRFEMVLSAFLAFGLTGCASIMHGSHQELTFQSNPDGATVTVSGRVIGKTPITTTLKKESGQTLVFSKDGYKSLSMSLETRTDSWFWGNIILGGLIGSTTDGLSGAVNEYSPSQYMVTLQPEGTTRLEEKPSLSENQKAKEFIVMGYREIIGDLQKGQGQYLNSLCDLLKIKPEQKPEAVRKIKALSDVYTNIPEFADRVIALYPTNAVVPTAETQAQPAPKAVSSKIYTGAAAEDALNKLLKGTKIKLTLKNGETRDGAFDMYQDDRVWIGTPNSISVGIEKVASLEVFEP